MGIENLSDDQDYGYLYHPNKESLFYMDEK